MTITYPHDRSIPNESLTDAPREEPFVPVYARTRSARGRKGGVKSWMILAPIGVLVLGAAAVVLVMSEGDEVAPAPLAEPAATGPVLPTQPLVSEIAPLETPAGTTIEVAPEPVVRAAPAPAPTRRAAPAPARRAAPAPTPAPATREAPAEPAGPQPYTSSLNTTPPTTAPATPAPTPAPPPVIVIDPAG
ncbi:hypothetical protein N0B44_31620 [Roseibacterium beibuensis]|uniref:hypothetical protein n=1 Tax=[Roseibacterium] beibuensis TaxID=1193142 RepID=UPI00217E82B0|nr:hypothetical protein [Roseibacterium beibuensis]MCS6627464.1 hypothetical protein [Roseibacterium beibuensis]